MALVLELVELEPPPLPPILAWIAAILAAKLLPVEIGGFAPPVFIGGLGFEFDVLELKALIGFLTSVGFFCVIVDFGGGFLFIEDSISEDLGWEGLLAMVLWCVSCLFVWILGFTAVEGFVIVVAGFVDVAACR